MLLVTATLLLQLAVASHPPDARLLREARAAQARFEQVRRMHLPRDWNGGSPGRCDAQIGRFCYWYDPSDSATEPPPEPIQIVEARDELIRFLDSSAARYPMEGWLAGQRVRYLIEAHHPDEAADAARECRAERWWCASLEALALHVGERYSAADSVFRIAVEEMPEAQRCEWLDLRRIVSDALHREFSRAPCAERARLADALWLISQPLWSTPGNDLRTEHFARLTWAMIYTRTANAYGVSFGDDNRELLLRYGWSEWFTRYDGTSGLYSSPAITGHDREPSYNFLPNVPSVRSVPRLTQESWSFKLPTARSRYAPRHVKRLGALTHQLVRLPRGDSTMIGVAFSVSDTALGGGHDSLLPFLAALQHGALRVGFVRQGTLWATVANDSAVASIEVQGARSKRAERARYTVDALPRSGAFCLSDLLLFDAAKYSGTDVEILMSHATTRPIISAREPLGVYWELEGTPSSEPAWISIVVEPVHIGLGRRLATRLHLARELAPVRLRWQGVFQRSREGQSVTLRLPSGARGKYRVVLTIGPPGGRAAPLSAAREIEVAP